MSWCYFRRGERREAELSLQKLRGDGCYIAEELRTMQTAVQRQQAETTSQMQALRSILTERVSRKAMLIGLGLMLFQQLSGINAVIFYTVTIFQAAGSTMSPVVATIIVGVVQVVISFLATLLVDRYVQVFSFWLIFRRIDLKCRVNFVLKLQKIWFS